MDVSKSIREFKYNGVALKDPGPQYSIEQCRELFAPLYPEIINAAIEGPTMAGNKTIYEFRKAVGTKGVSLRDRVDAAVARDRGGILKPPRALSTFHVAVADIGARRNSFHDEPEDIVSPALPDPRSLPLLP
jgi:PRTRC genetic system protein C